MNSVVIIPALNPGPELPAYARELLAVGVPRLVVVNDGSGLEYEHIFAELEAIPNITVLYHEHNCGKGRALKTAMRHVLIHYPLVDGVVTVDADGQHAAVDVCRVAAVLSEGGRQLVLGCRNFSLPQVPFRSRLGNRATSLMFYLLYGRYLPDTQTGLRGLPMGLLPQLLRVQGERFEYEMRVLVELLQPGIQFHQITIETRYFDGNKGSHFSTLNDALKVGRALLAGKRKIRTHTSRPNGRGGREKGNMYG